MSKISGFQWLLLIDILFSGRFEIFFWNFLEAVECDTQEHSFDQRIDQSEQSADQNNECDTVTVTLILPLG